MKASHILLSTIVLVTGARGTAAQATLGTQAGPVDPSEMEAFLQGFFAEELARAHCPGAIVVVVKDGRVALRRGFGYSDPLRHVASDPDSDRFYVGSVSKLFTATGAMQLCDRGALSLEEDVGRHLGQERIEERFAQPVTLENLLTHTSGIEDLFVLGGRPRRIRPPGLVISYSNHDFDLAGELIESVSGVPFAAYIERNILQPLGMARSTFEHREDLGAPIGWRYGGGGYSPQPWSFGRAIPSASLSSSASDMAAFMLAHLQDGEYRGARILSTETAQLMRRRRASNHPGITGIGLALWEWERNGQRGVEHKGDTTGYETGLYLLPSQGLGLFVSYNTQTRESPDRLLHAFVDHYYPAAAPSGEAPAAAVSRADLERYAGTYRWARCPKSTLGKLIAAGIEARVSAGDGGLHAEFVFLPIPPADYRPVAPQLFRSTAPSGEHLAFRSEPDGRISYMFTGPLAFERLPWYEGALVVTLCGMAFSVFFLVVSLGLPMVALVRRLRGRDAAAPALRPLRLASWASATLNLVFLVGLTLVLVGMIRTESFWQVPVALRLLLVIPLVTIPLAGALVLMNAAAWRQRRGSTRLRLAYGFYALGALAFIPYLAYWNLIGFNY